MKALIIDLKNQAVFFPEDIERVKHALERDFHIYAILRSHKYYLKTDDLTYYKNKIILPVFSPTKESSFTIPFQVYKDLDHKLIRIDSQYPYEKFSVIIEDEKWKSQHPEKEFCIEYNLTKISDKFLFQSLSDYDYKVLYIGKSYGKAGEREAVDRLKNHSTLQKILADCQNKYVGYNIHILLLDFKQDQLGKIINNGSLSTIVSSSPHFEEQQIINITEASLIHYFKPEYNKDFIINFPSENHSSYSTIYNDGCTELAIDLSYLFEAEHFPSLKLHTEHRYISKEKKYIHYKLKESETVLTSYPFDND